MWLIISLARGRIERRQSDRPIPNDFRCGTALPEQNDRAEDRVVGDPGEQLEGLGTPYHFLDGEAGEACPGRPRLDLVEHLLRGALDLGGRQVEADAVDIGLVHDVGGQDLYDHASGNPRGNARGLGGIARGQCLDRGDGVGPQHLLRLGLGQKRPSRPRARQRSACVQSRDRAPRIRAEPAESRAGAPGSSRKHGDA